MLIHLAPRIIVRTFRHNKKKVMKTYTNKTDRVDDRKCLYSEIKKGDKARKKAKRKEGKDEINKELKK